MTPEFDEYGVLIKRGKTAEDEFGIPIKKKESSVVSDVLSKAGSLAGSGVPSDSEAPSLLTAEPPPKVKVEEPNYFLRGNKRPEQLLDLRKNKPVEAEPDTRSWVNFEGRNIQVKPEFIPQEYEKTPEGAKQYTADLNLKIHSAQVANDEQTYKQALKEVEALAAKNRAEDHPGMLRPNDYGDIGRLIVNAPKSKVDVETFSDMSLSGKINADPNSSDLRNVELPDYAGAFMQKPSVGLLNTLQGVKKAYEYEVSNSNMWAGKPNEAIDLIDINKQIKKISYALQKEVDASQEAVVKSADTRSDLNKMTTGMVKEIQAQRDLYNVETLNSSFFTGLESRKYTNKTQYDIVKKILAEGKTLSSTEVAEFTAIGAEIRDGKNLQKLIDGEMNIDQYAEKYDQIAKDQENNLYKRKDVLTRSIANVIAEYYADEGTQFFGKWQVNDKEVDAVPAYVFEQAGIDIARPESKEVLREIKINEGFLPLDNAIQKDSYLRELGRGFIQPIKGIAKAIENAPKGDNELLVERKLEPITDYEKQRTEYFQNNYGKIADAFNGAGQFVSQYMLMVGGAGAVRGLGRAVGGSTEVAMVRSPEAISNIGMRAEAGGVGIRGGNELGNTIINHAQVYSNLAVPFVQTYDANFKSALEKTNNPLAARAVAFTNSAMESLSEQMFNNVKFGNSVIADFSGKNFGKIAKIFDRQVFDEAAGRELRQTIKEGLEGSIKAVAKGAGGLAMESLEEVPVQFADFVTSALADPDSVKDRHLLPELKDAFVSGMVSFSIPSLLGVAGRIKRQFSNNGTQDDALMLAARNRDMVMEAINRQTEDGFLSQEEADHKIQVLNTAVNALHNMPPVYLSGAKMTEADRSKYLSLSVQEKLIKQQMNKAEDDAVNQTNQARLDEIKAKKVGILTGITDQPLEEDDALQYDETLTPEEKAVVNLVRSKKELADLSDTALGRIIFDSMQDPASQKEAIQILIDQSSDPGALELNVGAKVTDAVLGLSEKSTQLTTDELAAKQDSVIGTVAEDEISQPIDLVPEDTSQEGVKVIGENEISPQVELNPKLPGEQQTVQQFAERIATGEKMDSPEDLQYYENNRTEIENILSEKVKAAQQRTTKTRVPAATMAIVNKFGVTPEVATKIEGIAAQAKDVNEFKTLVKELLGKSRTLGASEGDFADTSVNLEGITQGQYDDIRNRAAGLEGQEVVGFAAGTTATPEMARGVLENAGGVVWQEFPNRERMDAGGLRGVPADAGGAGNRGSQTGPVNALHDLGFGNYPGSNQKDTTGQTLNEILSGPGYTDEQRGMAAAYIAASRLLSDSPSDVVATIFGRAANSSKDSRGRIRIISNLNPEAPVIAASDQGFIIINAAKLGNRLKEFGGENKFLRWLDSALQEEVIHLATFKVTTPSDLTAVAQEMTKQQKQAVQDLYNPPALRNKPMSDFQLAAEYLRILVQERMSGVATELFKPQATRTKVRQVFAKLLAFIKNTFRGKTNPKATEIISRIETLVTGKENMPSPAVEVVDKTVTPAKPAVEDTSVKDRRIKELEAEREQAINNASRPDFKLDFPTAKQLVGSNDPVASKETQDDIKSRLKSLKELIDCLWKA